MRSIYSQKLANLDEKGITTHSKDERGRRIAVP
jgi:hypothetical protein